MHEKSISFLPGIIFVSSILVLMTAFVVVYVLYFLNKRQTRFINQLLQSQVEVQEATFQHIAKELHDNVGQLLSLTKMTLGTTRISLANEAPQSLKAAADTLAKAIHEMRALCRSLDKDWLEQFDFKSNLEMETDRINACGSIQTSFICHAYIDMEPPRQIVLFRIVQEAIQNALKHAKPSRIEVLVTETDKALYLSVSDDGVGIQEEPQGMGTNNMRQRTLLFEGTITWRTRKGGGTEVYMVIPLRTR